MGCDIHWAIERRGGHGRWELVAQEGRCWDAGDRAGTPWDHPDREAEQTLGGRDYLLFGALSNVRCDCAAPQAEEGVPDDAAATTRALAEGYHSHGWILGARLLEWARGAGRGNPAAWADDDDGDALAERLAGWARAAVAFLQAGGADEVLPPSSDDERLGRVWHDWNGVESAHERLERLSRSQQLVDWRHQPNAWRLLIWYDS